MKRTPQPIGLKCRFFTLILQLLAVGAAAQLSPFVRHFTPTDYGSQSQNWSLASTPEGWLVAGNNGCLLEFDGARWQQHLLPERQTVRAVAIGPGGEIFCGGFGAFGFWKKNASGALVFTALDSLITAPFFEKEEIWNIIVSGGSVYFQSFSTLYKYDYRAVTTLSLPGNIMFAREVGGRVVVPVIGYGLYEVWPDNTIRLLQGSEALGQKIVQFLVADPTGGICIGTTSDGIFNLKNGQLRPWDNPLNVEFKKYQLNRAIPLADGSWAVGTILNGLYLLAPDGSLRFRLNQSNGLQNNTVLALAETADGNLWCGLDRGIDFVERGSPLTFFTDPTGQIGTVYAAARHGGWLYVGTNHGVFARRECPEKTLCASNFQLVEGTQGQVWELQVFENQLLCGHNNGTFRIEGLAARKISDLTGGWQTLAVKPAILLQATYTGLILFSKNGLGNWQFDRRVSGFTEPLKKIAFDSLGFLWGAHPNRGLFRLRLSDDLTRVLEYRTFSTADGLPTDVQLDVVGLPGGRVVVGSSRGVRQVGGTATAVRFETISEIQNSARLVMPGLAGERVVADADGLFLKTENAVFKLPLNLVPGYEKVERLGEQEYLFCLENGFALLDRRLLNFQKNEKKLPLRIRDVRVAGTGEQFDPAQKLTFKWGQNDLIFRFAQPVFGQSPRFSWLLEGFSKQWSPWQSQPEKEFGNLPPGRYVFRLRSDAGGGEEARVEFTVEPPWYASGWAIGGYFLLAVGLFWAFEIWNRRRWRQQRERLRAENVVELDRQRTAAEHEKLVLEVENKSRELSNAALNLIRKNEALQSIRDELLAAQKEPKQIPKIIRQLDAHLEGDHDWAVFEESFNRVHDDFFKRLHRLYPDLTPGDMRLAAYLKMNLSSKEIAPLLNISVRGVENKRYRLRKRLGLPEEANLTEFFITF